MTDRQRLNESVSVRLTSDDRRAAERFRDGDCSGFLRLALRVMVRSLVFLQEDVQTRLGGKKQSAIVGGEVAVMRAVISHLESGQLDTRIAIERVGDWWVWVLIDGLVVRYGATQATVKGKEVPFAIAVKYSKKDETIDPVEFLAWAEVEKVGNVWSFGEALDA